MSYTIKKTDGTTLATVPENEIVLDKASIALVGRGATNYGVGHSENFVHLLENFAHTTAPEHPLQGQIWYDKTVGSLKVYNGVTWSQIGGGAGGTGADGSGMVYVDLSTGSALALVAGGKVVAALSSRDVPQVDLPETIQFLDAALPFRARFPNGLQGGQTLATDDSDFVYQGHVPLADAALYAGGGSPFGGTSWIDLGDNTVTLHISGDSAGGSQIMGVFSSAAISSNALPATVSIGGQTLQFQSKFPQGLLRGLTFAGGSGINVDGGGVGGDGSGSSITIGVVEDIVGTSLASAKTTWFAEADAKYATASVTTAITTSFTGATGQSTLTEAIDWLLTTASEGSGSAEAGTILRADIKNAITGASSFADALNKINVSVTTSEANSTALSSLTAQLLTGTGASSVANIGSALSTKATADAATAQKVDSISAAFTNGVPGSTSAASAITTIIAQANAAGGTIAGWSLDLNASGYIAGLQLNANSATKTSDIIMHANSIKLYNDLGALTAPFEVKDGAVYIKNLMIGNGSIGYEKLKTISFTTEKYLNYTWTGSGTQAIYGGACNIQTGQIPAGTKVVLFFNASVYGGDSDEMYMTCRRTGTSAATLAGRAEFGCPDSGGASQAWTYTDTVPADGEYTYTIWGEDHGGVHILPAHFIGLVQKA